MGKPNVHIYLLSRLVFADVTDWQKIMKQLREGRKSMFWSYKPLREGAFQMASDKNADNNAIYTSVAQLAERAGGDRCRKANLAALAKFENVFLSHIEKVKSNFMGGDEQPVDFGEVQLIGGPHFSVTDAGGKEKWLYLHPSKWTDEEVTAFCELLTVIGEKRYKSNARDIWFLDLRTGERVPWTSSKKLVRRKCEKAAEFLVALQAANLAEGEN
jgi:hypothetical protein